MSAPALADDLRARIHRGELGPGDRLPAERELAGDLGVSRQRLRDALRELEGEGYLLSRRGAHGGWFVTELARPFAAWAARSRHDIDDMVDFRLAVECRAAALAAGRRSRQDLRAMTDAVEALTDAEPRAYRLADVAFHSAVALAARSERLFAAVERARGELFEPVEELWHDHRTSESQESHRAVLDAIEASDPEAAAKAMADHIETTRRELLALSRRVRSKV